MDAGLFVARLVLGMLMAAHGSQKLFGWFGGYGLNGTAGFFEALGFRPGRLFVATAAATEIVGGLLLAAGFLSPVASALIVAVMIVAAVSVHWQHGVFAATNGIEAWRLFRGCAGWPDAVLDAGCSVERPGNRRHRRSGQSGAASSGRTGGSRVKAHAPLRLCARGVQYHHKDIAEPAGAGPDAFEPKLLEDAD
jgi:putative oxidoreductase